MMMMMMRFTPMAVYPMLLVDIHRKSECSGKSHSIKSAPTTAAVRIKAEAERATLITRAALLMENNSQAEKKKGIAGDRSRHICISSEARRLSSCLRVFKWLTNTFRWRLFHYVNQTHGISMYAVLFIINFNYSV